jgi:hypothetical protein
MNEMANKVVGWTKDHSRSRLRESLLEIITDIQGAGNTVFPLLMHNENPDLTLWATDYSAQAVDVVKVGHHSLLRMIAS